MQDDGPMSGTQLLDRLGLEYPLIQAGMGGGLSASALAGAVSRAGGLGTIGILPPDRLAREIRLAHEIAPGRPVAVNLLLPFTRQAHVRTLLAEKPRVVSLFSGFSPSIVAALRGAGIVVFHQVGTVEEARRAVADKADALIVQGMDAGGHVLGRSITRDPLREVKKNFPRLAVYAAGGIAVRYDIRKAMEDGADGVAMGTRFLLTQECRAHDEYKKRVLGAPRTILTMLFGMGWPALHRVVPNAATDRWCRRNALGPAVSRAVYSCSGWMGKIAPLGAPGRIHGMQSLAFPFYSPAALLDGEDPSYVEHTPLYAGESGRNIHAIVPAGEAVRDLLPAFH